jgi:hypothetical protein
VIFLWPNHSCLGGKLFYSQCLSLSTVQDLEFWWDCIFKVWVQDWWLSPQGQTNSKETVIVSVWFCCHFALHSKHSGWFLFRKDLALWNWARCIIKKLNVIFQIMCARGYIYVNSLSGFIAVRTACLRLKISFSSHRVFAEFCARSVQSCVLNELCNKAQ